MTEERRLLATGMPLDEIINTCHDMRRDGTLPEFVSRKKVYDLVERPDAPPPPQSSPQVDLSRYVTIDQLEDILTERLKRSAKASKTKEDTSNE